MKNKFYKASIDTFNELSCIVSQKEIVWKKGLKFSRVMSIDGMDIIDVEQLRDSLL